MYGKDGKLENSEGDWRGGKLETKKGKKRGEENPKVKMKERSSMQALNYKIIMHNFAGIST